MLAFLLVGVFFYIVFRSARRDKEAEEYSDMESDFTDHLDI